MMFLFFSLFGLFVFLVICFLKKRLLSQMSHVFEESSIRVKLLNLIWWNLSAPQDASSIINMQISSKRVCFYRYCIKKNKVSYNATLTNFQLLS